MNIYESPNIAGVITPVDPASPPSVSKQATDPSSVLSSFGNNFPVETNDATEVLPTVLPTLCEVVLRCTSGRAHATTAEFSYLTGKAPQTIRKNHSQTGACFGIRPIKVGNALLWPTNSIARLLGGR
jgi:hypothetical protein